MATDFKDTLNLPKTEFPMRANLVQREPARIKHWEKNRIYDRQEEKRANSKTFILHDGPPFTNGNIHLGHVLNKTLKDLVLRYKNMRGYRTPYIVGWDCHGLPIEHAVSKELQKKGSEMTALDIRTRCAEFSEKFIGIQREQFRRLGIATDWKREYKTKDPQYEGVILETFAEFVAKDLVYRSKKPVYWSIPCETALAEAEIEYREHVSPSIWVKFPLTGEPNTSIVIWTTTPWTLPANLAVAVHPRLEYVNVEHEGQSYIVAKELAEAFISNCKLEGATLGKTRLGTDLENVEARHPFIDRASPIVLADYVTTESGTGCVHTAPGHGLDDYLTGIKYGLEIYCPIDDQGRYVNDGQIPSDLVGVTVLETEGKCPANSKVLSIIKENGTLLHVEKYKHQYPHCWRSKTPVIFRAMDQWFVSLDKNETRAKVLDAIEEVNWIPDWGKNRIRGAVETRPDWCISRQRSWGVPLPVFFDEDGGAYLDAEVIRGLAKKIAEKGTDLWFAQEPEQLLEGIELPASWKGKKLRKGGDTLDVWIDSGCSHRAVLHKMEGVSWPADLYLEGSDQHRGWFQSSIWTGVIADGSAPYRNILTHGFTVDEHGRKLSKSDGAKTATQWIDTYGADILRLLICSQDYKGDMPISENGVKQVMNSYRLLRNTLRFQLGNLHDFDASKDLLDPSELLGVDKWALAKTAEFLDAVTQAYDNYEFHRVYQLATKFCDYLSAVYHSILKDRLYTYEASTRDRRSGQTVVYHQFNILTKVMAPALAFTMDEAYCFARTNSDYAEEQSVHLEDWPTAPDSWRQSETATEIDRILVIRDKVNEKLEELRVAKTIGQSLDAKVILKGKEGNADFELLKRYEKDLPELFIVSQVYFETSLEDELEISAAHADGVRCPRCWRWVTELAKTSQGEEVCPRCAEALATLETSKV